MATSHSDYPCRHCGAEGWVAIGKEYECYRCYHKWAEAYWRERYGPERPPRLDPRPAL